MVGGGEDAAEKRIRRGGPSETAKEATPPAPLSHEPDAYFHRSLHALEQATRDPAIMACVQAAAATVVHALRSGKKLLIIGNGGSAADAQHIAAEMLSRFVMTRAPLPAIALTTDTSVLTAIGNDFGYAAVFERQVRALAQDGDVLLALSTSGGSENVLAALRTAREMGVHTIGFTGSHGHDMAPLCDLCLRAPSEETAVIQQIHMVAAHALCGIVERECT
jgi:D-sedoheptulose 7-phosphate isomerase